MPEITIRPAYGAISAAADICEPWIEAWGGDEWGESLRACHSATHTDYGLSDEDCATIAAIMVRNVIIQHEWIVNEGYSYGVSSPEEDAKTAEEAREARNYWLKGGNLRGWSSTIEDAKSTIEQLPGWMFGE